MNSMSLSGSVGKGGKNNKKDVKLVQALLNVYFRTNKKPTISISGTSDNDLESHIATFQKDHLKLKTPDSRVDVGGKTFMSLKGVLAATFKKTAVNDPTLRSAL
jgi:hypothetical protein